MWVLLAWPLLSACAPTAMSPPPRDRPLESETGSSPEMAMPVLDTAPTYTDPSAELDCAPGFDCESGICWVTICGGSFWIGSPPGVGLDIEQPQVEVTVPTYQLMQSEITVEQYARCVADGSCPPAAFEGEPPPNCTERPPYVVMNCMNWSMADLFCAWAGGRLPSASEWEYAARNRGQDVLYPWGDETPSCDLARLGCGEDCDEWSHPGPPCSVPGGTTDQGVCDLAGNAIEWVQDTFHSGYADHPRDGSAWEGNGSFKEMRGGGLNSCVEPRAAARTFHAPDFYYSGSSARCVRDSR